MCRGCVVLLLFADWGCFFGDGFWSSDLDGSLKGVVIWFFSLAL